MFSITLFWGPIFKIWLRRFQTAHISDLPVKFWWNGSTSSLGESCLHWLHIPDQHWHVCACTGRTLPDHYCMPIPIVTRLLIYSVLTRSDTLTPSHSLGAPRCQRKTKAHGHRSRSTSSSRNIGLHGQSRSARAATWRTRRTKAILWTRILLRAVALELQSGNPGLSYVMRTWRPTGQWKKIRNGSKLTQFSEKLVWIQWQFVHHPATKFSLKP